MFIVFAFAGCSSSSSSSPSSSNGSGGSIRIQTLSFMAAQTKAVVKAFEDANPGTKVNVDSITADQLSTNGTVLSSANPPDIGFVDINRPAYQQLTKANQLVSLSSVWSSQNLKQRYGTSVATALQNGSSTPYIVAIDGIYYGALTYNKKLFGQLGIPEPTNHRFGSFAELDSAVAKLTAHGDAGIAIGGNTAYTVSNLVDPLLPTSASPSQLTNYLTSWNPEVPLTARYTDPAFVNVLNEIKAMNDKSYFQKGFLGQTPEQAQTVFTSGKAGMYLSGSMDVATLHKSMGSDVDWALLPPLDTSKTTQLDIFFDAMGIPKNAKNPTLAMKFLEFYVTPQAQALVLAAGDNLPTVNDLPASARATDSLVNEMIGDAATNGSQLGWTSSTPASVGQGSINPLIQKMMLGQTSPTDIAGSTQSALDSVRSGK